MSRVARLVGASALTGYTALQVLGRRAGSTAQERAASLPGDELVLDPQMVTNHVGTTAATPEHIWPWLTQAGWPPAATTRPGGSTDLLFRENWPSLDYLDPNLLHPSWSATPSPTANQARHSMWCTGSSHRTCSC